MRLKYTKIFFLAAFSCFPFWATSCQPKAAAPQTAAIQSDTLRDTLALPVPVFRVRSGAEKLIDDLSTIEGKRIGLVANHTSRVGETHLADTLLALGQQIVCVFSPEHGFRGDADAGEKVASTRDARTGLPLISLYGSNKKPTAAQLADIDVVIFDMQDVGSRHYTYISTMSYVMEACAELKKPILILDRPNPNGSYVGGPVLEPGNESFIGMHPIPIVHGMTIGEYAQMVNGEGWLKNKVKADLTVIPCEGYRHDMRWSETGLPWISPSPNLAAVLSAELYPALCWFEATPVSVGRGTDSAFSIVGAPWYVVKNESFDSLNSFGLRFHPLQFTPRSIPGKAKTPPLLGKVCHGYYIDGQTSGDSLLMAGLVLISDMYRQHKLSGDKTSFFGPNFSRWSGNRTLQQQIVAGKSPAEILASWEKGLAVFREKREKYLLYR